jgi:hypothetical protein
LFSNGKTTTMTTRKTWVLGALLLGACGVDSGVTVDEGVLVEEADAASETTQDVRADVLNVVSFPELDVAPGNLNGRVARLFTTAASARAFISPVLPSITFTRNWLVAYRPEGKSPRARVEVTRAQLSSTGKTLTLWATVTEPGAGCQAWRPNELAVARIPSRAVVPTSIRVLVTRATADCGLTVGPTCVPQSTSCPQATPYCLGSYQRPDETFTQGTCVKFTPYENTRGPRHQPRGPLPTGVDAGHLLDARVWPVLRAAPAGRLLVPPGDSGDGPGHGADGHVGAALRRGRDAAGDWERAVPPLQPVRHRVVDERGGWFLGLPVADERAG